MRLKTECMPDQGKTSTAMTMYKAYFILLFNLIPRLVNGFMESPHKETGRSISDLAETVGVPRILVDIRHG